jgi:hypothetical protein
MTSSGLEPANFRLVAYIYIYIYIWALSPRVKQLGRKADHSPPSNAEVKNGEAVPSLPIFLNGIVLN